MVFSYNKKKHIIRFTQDGNCVRISNLDHNKVRESLEYSILNKTSTFLGEWEDGAPSLEISFKQDKIVVLGSVPIYQDEDEYSTIKVTFTGDEIKKEIMKVVNNYKTKFKIEKKQGSIIIHTYDGMSRKIKMTKSDISDILKLDNDQNLSLQTKEGIKFKNNKSYSNYEDVDLDICENNVKIYTHNSFIQFGDYTFDRKAFISELKKI